MSDNFPPISVVVIGRNEGERLVLCLESVRAADYPGDKIELIYVDTDSTDDSCAAAEKFGAKVIRIQPERPTAAAARNAGLGAANHELIQFLDGDTILNRSWLKKAVVSLDDPSVACLFGRVEEVAPAASIYNFWAHHDWYVSPGRKDFCGGIALFRREVILQAGGYDDSLIAGEERDLCCRLIRDRGVAMVCLNEPMALHDINMTRFGQYWKRCFRSGYAYAQVAARYPGLRRWRRTCLRNILHASVALTAIGLSLGSWSIGPVGIWAVLLVLAVGRNTMRYKAQVRSTSGAFLYSVHHYLSKAPTVLGHLTYYRRHVWGGRPKGLVKCRRGLPRNMHGSNEVLHPKNNGF